MKTTTLIFALLFTCALFAQEFVVDGIRYTVTSTTDPYTVEVKSSSGFSPTINIPDTVTNNDITYSVTSIGDTAFDQASLTSVTIGNNVTTIGVSAFLDNSLNSVTIGNNVTTIGFNAFFVNNLTSITIPESVTTIGEQAFGINNLTNITIPESVTSIGDSAFASNPLTIVISESFDPATLTSSVFSNRSSISLTIPAGTTEVYESAGWAGFNLVTEQAIEDFVIDGIEYTVIAATPSYTVKVSDYVGTSPIVVIPNTVTYGNIAWTVTTIGDDAFRNNSLTSVTIPDSVIRIGELAFYFNALTTVVSQSLNPATIDDFVFDNHSLIDLSIPTGTTEIYEAAGWTGFNAVSLFDATFTVDDIEYTITALTDPYTVKISDYTGSSTTVNIPTTVTNYGFTFTVTTIGEVAFLTDGLTSVIIPNSVTSIEEGAFLANDLTSVTIPDSVTSIGDNAFSGNDLTTVISESLDPATLADNVFDNRSLIDLSIPKGTTEAYETAGWTGFNAVSLFDKKFTIDGIEYTITSYIEPYTVEVSWYTGTSTTVDIPATVNNNGFTFAVTAVGTGAFFNKSLTSVTIPESVTSIGDLAFYQNSLISVTIPDSVTSIGERTFSDNGLTSVAIGNSVTSIGDLAFYQNSLTSVTIPDNVTTIGNNAFAENDLTNVTIGNGVTSIGSYAFYQNSLISVTIPDSAITIGNNAFWRNSLTSVTIGNSVTSIGEEAFRENELTSITIPGSVTSIADEAFADNDLTTVISESLDPATLADDVFDDRSLIDLSIPIGTTDVYQTADWTGFNSVTEQAIEDFVIDGIEYIVTAATDLYTVEASDYIGSSTTVNIPTTVNNNGFTYTVTTIGNNAFRNNSLTSVTIPDSVTSIGDYAFRENELTSVTIPNSVTSIGRSAFFQNSLTSVTIPDSVTTIGDYAFFQNSLTSVTIPDSITTISDYAFCQNSLTSVTIPNSVTTIGDYAFTFNNLTNLTIGNSVTSIGSSAFYINNLTSVISESLDPATLLRNVFDNHSLIDLTIPTGTTETYITKGWTGFNSVTEQAIEEFIVDGIRYTITSTADPYTVEASDYIGSSTTLNIPNTVTNNGITYTVTTIGLSAFFNKSLTNVTIPDSIISIGEGAFQRNSLTSVTIPDSVTAIGNAAFGENSLINVTIGSSVTSIGNYAFAGNDLVSVTIPDSVTSIGDYAFYQNSLTSVIISNSVTTIGDGTFLDNNLASITIPDSVTTIGGSAFCSNELTSVIIPSSVTTIGDYAFCSNELTNVISESLDPATLLSNVFDNHSLIDLTIPTGTTDVYITKGWTGFNSVTEQAIEEFVVDGIRYTITAATDPYTVEASDYIGSSTTVNIPTTVTNNGITYTVTTIGNNAFFQNSLTSITIPDSVTTIGENAFRLNDLTSVIIGNSVTTIGDEAFFNNDLTSVTIPNSVTSIGEEAFFGNDLTSVTIGNSVTSIGAYAFASNNLISITIPDNVTTIGDSAFRSNNLTSVTIPNSVTTIGVYAFRFNDLTSVIIGNSVTTIGDEAFAGNDLTSVISESLDPAILLSDVFDNRSIIGLTIPTGTTETYITKGWTGFNSITEVLNISIIQNHVSCNGGSDGSATVIVTGGTEPYTYLWSNNETTASITGLAAGTYTVIITDANSDTASAEVIITEPDAVDATFSYGATSYCVNGTNPTPTISGTTGGTFSADSGLSIDASKGEINLSDTTPNTYTITYTTEGTCPNSTTFDVTITAEDATFAYGAAFYCTYDTNPIPTISGTTGGTFTADSGLSIDASTGEINLSDTTPNTYTITYTNGGACPDATTFDVTVTAMEDATFSYGAASYCINDTNPIPTISGTTGGTFTAGSGLSIDASTGEINLSDTTPNTYTITYTTEGTCSNATTFDVTITASPCANDNIPVIAPSQSFDIAENAANATSVGVVQATDDDVTPTTFSSWTIVSGNEDSIFTVDTDTGEITVSDNMNLDTETTASYELGITVSDGINISAPETVTINISDVNDNIPVITPSQSFDIAENVTNATTIGLVQATDADVTPTTFGGWAIVSGNEDGIFVIDTSSGEIRVMDNTNLGVLTNTDYTLVINVSDGTNISVPEEVHINVINIDQEIFNSKNIAEAITPNNDGINDTWIIKDIEDFPNSVVKVYNRSGKEVFAARGYQNDWNGVYKSKTDQLPQGTYYFIINLNDGKKPLDGWLYINY